MDVEELVVELFDERVDDVAVCFGDVEVWDVVPGVPFEGSLVEGHALDGDGVCDFVEEEEPVVFVLIGGF